MPENDKPVTSGGERPGTREKMDSFTRTLIQNGASPAYAERKARETAIRYDRNNK
jgi:hypothetical protein